MPENAPLIETADYRKDNPISGNGTADTTE
uniref:Uncharacterized protein n=1 Tax=Anguilla anguilla TaxID=7936 RepID=A0A0E9T3J8_ANGAN